MREWMSTVLKYYKLPLLYLLTISYVEPSTAATFVSHFIGNRVANKRCLPFVLKNSHITQTSEDVGQPTIVTSTQEENQVQRKPKLRTLYGPSTAFANGTLNTLDGIHTIYYEQHGKSRQHHNDDTNENEEDKPFLNALFLHGGPGAGCFPNHARFFDPQHYHIVLMDQRGCGKSTPRGCTEKNTLKHLIQDCEQLRQHLNISKWDVVLGGSWGVTLALGYAQEYPKSVRSLILRGVCLMRDCEIDWMFGSGIKGVGASLLFPEQWENFAKAVRSDSTNLDVNEQSSIQGKEVLLNYYNRLLGSDPLVRLAAAKSWMAWEMMVFASSRYANASSATVNSTESDQSPQVAVYSGGRWSLQDEQAQIIVYKAPGHESTMDSEACEAIVRNLRQGLKDDLIVSGNEQDSSPVQVRPVPPLMENVTAELLTMMNSRNSSNATQLSEEQLESYMPVQNMLTCFYSVNNRFALDYMNLLDPQKIELIQDIPCIAIHGGKDRVCPVDTALDLLRKWPAIELRVPLESGHSMYDPSITDELVRATDRMISVLNRKTEVLGDGNIGI